LLLLHVARSRDSAVGIATGYGLDDWGVGVRRPVGSRICSTSSRSSLGSTQLPTQWALGTLSAGVKRPEREVDQSPPSRQCRGQENVDLHIHTPIRLHGVMIN
jgi:hypothetical protein